MTKSELLEILRRESQNGDIEVAHSNADDALVEFINDPEIKAAYEEVDKWYA